MFYSAQILAKKGPLGTVWIAAHVDKRLKRHQIFETSIPSTVDSIINPEAPLALRLSGQLLLGVVRIYNRKVQYLYEDCNHAIIKVQLVDKGAATELPEGLGRAVREAITRQEVEFDIYATGTFTSLEDVLDPIEDDDEPLPFTKRLSMGGRKSMAPFEDDLDPFRSSQRFDDDMFEDQGLGLDLEREFGGEEPERARAAGNAVAGADAGLFGLTPGKEQGYEHAQGDYYPDGDEEAVPATAPEAGAAAGGLPSPAGPLTGPSSAGAGFDLSPGVLPSIGGLSGPSTPERALSLRAGAPIAGKRRRPKLDVSADARPATELPGEQMRALLADRTPLMCMRGAPAKRLRAQLPLAPDDVRNIQNRLLRPAFTAFLAPELQALFVASLDRPSQERPEASAERPIADAAARDGPVEGAEIMDGDYGIMNDGPEYEPEAAEAAAGPDGASPAATAEEQPSHADAGFDSTFADGEELGEAAEDVHSRSSFTMRTRHVAGQLQGAFQGLALNPKAKRSRTSMGSASAPDSIRLQQFTAGKARLDAARWFFELLVLKTKDFVELEQQEPYADIAITQRPLLKLAGAA